MTADNKFDFSKAASELEQITQELEDGNLTLDEAIVRFEKGAELAEKMKKYLNQAENKITTIKSKFE